MRDAVADALMAFEVGVLAYFLVLNSWYLLLIGVASWHIAGRWHARLVGVGDLFQNPLTPGVTVVLPAHDEAPVIVQSVQAMLALRYPSVEVVVVDDGSTDGTFERLREAFDLVDVPKVVPELVPVSEPVTSAWMPRGGEPLLVVRKPAGGTKADPLNVGICLASQPLTLMVDADAILDEEALLRVVRPFVEDPLRVVATGGVIRAANGSSFYRGRLVEARMPPRWLPRIQIVEYLRAFLLGRIGWSRLGALVVISGAFGLFRRDVLIEVGGMAHNTHGEDAELVTRIHRHLRRERRPYAVEFVADPVCWTEVPSTFSALASQRRRWSRGLGEMFWRHRSMVGNPRYGRVGMLAMPYLVVFEAIGPAIELAGFVILILGLSFGLIDGSFAVLFLAVAVGYGIFLSVAALAVEELTYRGYPRWRDLGVGLLAAVVENFGYRQLHAWWRLRGLVQAVHGREVQWGAMTRTGFDPD
jgi:cellulose synthase/poly-beta-1,6-N-acetylglucosamine synthase-like glycosyltransferase